MVTKQEMAKRTVINRYILAKNHMVTKLSCLWIFSLKSYILAKNHMVTKPQIS